MPIEHGAGSPEVFLAPVLPLLEKMRPPEGPFDPAGAWRHEYAVCALHAERGGRGEHPRAFGRLTLAKKPAEGERFVLDVSLSISTRQQTSGGQTHASIVCSADRLATPVKWELRGAALGGGTPPAPTEFSDTRTARGTAATSNWSLMEAVQRLPFEGFAPLAFDMMEDLDLRKPGQTLKAVGAVSAPIGGKSVRLHAYRQLGRGILPTHYWVDGEHRLIAVTGSLKAYLWDAAGAGSARRRR